MHASGLPYLMEMDLHLTGFRVRVSPAFSRRGLKVSCTSHCHAVCGGVCVQHVHVHCTVGVTWCGEGEWGKVLGIGVGLQELSSWKTGKGGIILVNLELLIIQNGVTPHMHTFSEWKFHKAPFKYDKKLKIGSMSM